MTTRPEGWYEGHSYAMRDVAHAIGREDVTLEDLAAMRARAEAAEAEVARWHETASVLDDSIERARAAEAEVARLRAAIEGVLIARDNLEQADEPEVAELRRVFHGEPPCAVVGSCECEEL